MAPIKGISEVGVVRSSAKTSSLALVLRGGGGGRRGEERREGKGERKRLRWKGDERRGGGGRGIEGERR